MDKSYRVVTVVGRGFWSGLTVDSLEFLFDGITVMGSGLHIRVLDRPFPIADEEKVQDHLWHRGQS